jgi:predicted RNase H-like nuclease (RuvC/YqgF family)
MEAGERELRKAFEDVTTGNVRTMIDYCTKTREMVQKSKEDVQELKRMLAQRDEDVVELRRQLGILQGKIYQYGTEH